ncbi:MAG: PKD domain-containing protein [Desulfobacula sp.]|nr:PKD domain-containing protein [Desulfobacula sp.]
MMANKFIFWMVMAACFAVSNAGYAGEHKTYSKKLPVLVIHADPKIGEGPLKVRLEPETKNLEEPLSFEWNFGDGNTSTQKKPLPHFFDYGKYIVILKVTDGTGKTLSASVTVFADYPCG